MSIAVYPGSFDPITCGHLDIIRRGSVLFDEVIIAVLNNSSKNPLFSAEERVRLIEKSTADLPNCRAVYFDGLLVDFVTKLGANVVIKGLRAISDFEYEFQMALLNKNLNPDIETLFMVTNANHSYISSSVVKEIANLGGDFADLVPKEIFNDVKQKIEKGR
ncbi:MAG: pantetheine-phosphate adenylyltransferase [Clostridia bacterium]|nr:pantetheine-phosphate adenylyltransferase [Clostridia bacterium]